jgi:hypothetical protein
MSDAPDADRIDQLENRIDRARDNLTDIDPTVEDEPKFKDRGALSDDAVDDTIAPPG